MAREGVRMEIDAYARRSSLYSFDPRVKLVCTIALILVVALLTSLEALVVASVFVLGLALVSRVPAQHLGSNFFLALIFILFASLTMWYYRGWESALAIGLRISVCVLALLLMVTTTPFFRMLGAMRALRLPSMLTSLILFTYRFIFLLLEEMDHMRLARRARGFEGGRSLRDRRALGILSNTIGMTFVRANARATNIYDALLLRGYTGEMRTFDSLHSRPRDVAFATCFALTAGLAILVETGVVPWTL